LFIEQRRVSAGAQRLPPSRIQIQRLLRNDVCLSELDKKSMDKRRNIVHNILWLEKAVHTLINFPLS